ncbi:hypothetical protein EYF80_031070 [Liparis tanakae]|uniref:Uncharacterized protein n=1 Tax=Liparis tanakae TaxID=230148 RepID=A0A4Z2H062_9TELE|nr:hypothetical protein EYF80_031070 [Liparis tanakae]
MASEKRPQEASSGLTRAQEASGGLVRAHRASTSCCRQLIGLSAGLENTPPPHPPTPFPPMCWTPPPSQTTLEKG